MSFIHRRMLPSDIGRCLVDADIAAAAEFFGKTKQLEERLDFWLRNGQMWGSVVERTDTKELVTFGGGVYLSDGLAADLAMGDHPFLLLDLATEPRLCREVLEFDQVASESDSAWNQGLDRKAGLNFYGTLFRWPKPQMKFFMAMDCLQASLILGTAGFNIKRHFKHVFPKDLVHASLSAFAMRVGFGARKLHQYETVHRKYPDIAPVLFGQTRETEEALRKSRNSKGVNPTSKVGQVLCQERPILNLPYNLREVLWLEREKFRPGEMQPHLSGKSKSNDVWDNWYEKRVKLNDLPQYVSEASSLFEVQREIRNYVEQHPGELRVLRPLTVIEAAEAK